MRTTIVGASRIKEVVGGRSPWTATRRPARVTIQKTIFRRWTPPGRLLGRPIRLLERADGSYLKGGAVRLWSEYAEGCVNDC